MNEGAFTVSFFVWKQMHALLRYCDIFLNFWPQFPNAVLGHDVLMVALAQPNSFQNEATATSGRFLFLFYRADMESVSYR